MWALIQYFLPGLLAPLPLQPPRYNNHLYNIYYGIRCYNICSYNIRCYNICFLILCHLCLCFSICFLDPPSVCVVLGNKNTSLASYFQALTRNMKWLSIPSIVTTYAITTSAIMVIVLVVSIVAVVISSNFITVSTFSIVMGVTTSSATTFSTDLTLTCCYGIYCYNISCYNICFLIRYCLCLFFSICFLDPPISSVVLNGKNASMVAHFQALINKMKWFSSPQLC